MYHPAGFGEAGERSYPGRCNPHASLKSGAIQPAKWYPFPRAEIFAPPGPGSLSPHRRFAHSPFRPFAVSLFRLPPLLPLSDLLLPLTSIDHEGVVIAVESPWTRGDLRGFQKFPVGGVRWLQMQIITYRW